MAEDSHAIPLAHVRIYPRSDEEFANNNTKQKFARRQRRSSKCFVYFLLAVVLLSIAVLVFGVAVLRMKSPQIKIGTIEIQNLSSASSPASLSMTMIAEISINNANYGRFQFQNSSTSVLYGNTTIASRDFDGGRVEARDSRRMNVSMEVRSASAALLAENRNFSSEIDVGLVKLSSFAKVRGEVRVFKIITRNRTAVMNCSMNLNLTTQSVQDLQCL